MEKGIPPRQTGYCVLQLARQYDGELAVRSTGAQHTRRRREHQASEERLLHSLGSTLPRNMGSVSGMGPVSACT